MTVLHLLKKNLWFEFENPRRFVTAQCLPDRAYLAWTTFWSLYNVTWLALEPYLLYRRGALPDNLWFVFLTHWGYITLTLDILTDCVTSYYVQFRRTDIMQGTDGDMPWYLKLNWCLYNIGTTTAVAITILYFGFLGLDLRINSINFHIVTSVYVVLNLWMTNKPMRPLHLIYPMIFAIIYISFSAIHQSATGIVIYTALDWNNLSKTLPLSLVLMFVGVPVIHLIFFGLTKFREHLCCTGKSDEVV